MQVGGGEVEYLTEKFCSLRNVPEFFSPTKFFFQKCSWGSETHAQTKIYFSGGGGGDFGVGKQYTSSHDM